MHNFLSPFSSFVFVHPILAYGVLFLGVFWEGEISLIMAGILVHLGIFSLPITVSVAIVGAILKTVLGYRLGYYLGQKFPNARALKYFEKKVFYFLPRFRERPFWSIMISKGIYGLNNATLIFAGYVKADFKTYIKAEFISSTVWLGSMFILGVYFSSKALSISHNFRNFSFLVLLFILGFIILQKMISIIIEIVEDIQIK